MAQLTETELLKRFVEGMKMAKASAKMLGLGRNSNEWITIDKTLGQIADVAARQAVKSTRPPVSLVKFN